MKHLYFLLLSLLTLNAHAQTWLGLAPAIQPVYPYTSSVQAIAADTSGNVYITGYFSGTVTFGSTTLTNWGYQDIFVAKWSNGSYIWAQQAGGASIDQPTAISVEGPNVYITGNMDGLSHVGPIALSPSVGFVAKLQASDGAVVWARAMTGRTPGTGGQAWALAVNGGNIYVAGSFLGTTDFGNISVSSRADEDLYVAKLTDVGATASYTWVQRAGESNRDAARALAVEGNNVYVGGYCLSPIPGFGNLTTSTTGYGFVAKLVDAGTSSSFIWLQRGGGTGGSDNQVSALAVQGASVYAGGYFSGATAEFGSATLPNSGSVNSFDGFVVKYTDAGLGSSVNWAQRVGGRYNDGVYALAATATDVYAGGYFSTDTLRLGRSTLVHVSNNDALVAKLNGTTGSFVWGQQAGGNYADDARALAVTRQGRVYVGGGAVPPARFEPYVMPTPVSFYPIGYLAWLEAQSPLSAADDKPTNKVSIYPSPARGLVRVSGISASVKLVLCDGLGRVLRKGEGNQLSVAGLVPGVYVLRMETSTATLVRRLAVE